MKRLLFTVMLSGFMLAVSEGLSKEPVGTLKAGVVGSGKSIEPVFWGCFRRHYCAPRFCVPRYSVRVYRYCPPAPCYVPIYRPYCFGPMFYGYTYTPPAIRSAPSFGVPIYSSPLVNNVEVPRIAPQVIESKPQPSVFAVPENRDALATTGRLPSNSVARERSRKYIAFGDALFREQKFHSALQRYKSAAEAAPDVAESYFRQGHALVTTNRFELAAKAFKVGIALSDDVTRDGFHVDELYADNHMAKRAHLEALAQSSLIDRANTDLLFLVGLFLRYDGQADRATKFFLKAAEIAGTESLHLRPFLPVEKRDPVLFAATKYET